MKKVLSPRPSAFLPVAFYLNDVEEAIAILSENGSKPVMIGDDEYQFDSLEEFIQQRGKYPRALILEAESSCARLQLAGGTSIERGFISLPLRASLRVPPEPDLDSTYFRLRELLEKRRTLLSRILGPALWGLTAVFFALWIVSTIWLHWPRDYFFQFAILFFTVTALAGPRLLLGSRLNLERRHETTTFWSRNKDQLRWFFIASGSTVVGWFAKTVFDRMFHTKP
jgi:hypothetical protein